jgi:hypothetical protein
MVRVEGIENVAFTGDGGVRPVLRDCQNPTVREGRVVLANARATIQSKAPSPLRSAGALQITIGYRETLLSTAAG